MKQIEIDGVIYNNYITKDGRVLKKSGTERRYKYKDYKYVTLNKDGKQFFVAIHRLLAIHYIPNPHRKQQVNHIDGDKLNNNLSNLEWTTASENVKHAYDIGLKVAKSGSECNFHNHGGKWMTDRRGSLNPNWKGGIKTNNQK